MPEMRERFLPFLSIFFCFLIAYSGQAAVLAFFIRISERHAPDL